MISFLANISVIQQYHSTEAKEQRSKRHRRVGIGGGVWRDRYKTEIQYTEGLKMNLHLVMGWLGSIPMYGR